MLVTANVRMTANIQCNSLDLKPTELKTCLAAVSRLVQNRCYFLKKILVNTKYLGIMPFPKVRFTTFRVAVQRWFLCCNWRFQTKYRSHLQWPVILGHYGTWRQDRHAVPKQTTSKGRLASKTSEHLSCYGAEPKILHANSGLFIFVINGHTPTQWYPQPPRNPSFS